MASTAFSMQGAAFTVGVSGSAKNISGLTQANPAVVTATAHGLSDGAVVKFASVGGMTQINGLLAVVKVLTANTFQASGINSTGFDAYTSSGTATPTAAVIGNVRSFTVGGATKNEIDVTNLASTTKEFKGSLGDPGNYTLEFDYAPADEGQQAIRSGFAVSGVSSSYKITFSNATSSTITFNGEPFSFDVNGGVDDVARGSATIRRSGDVVYTI